MILLLNIEGIIFTSPEETALGDRIKSIFWQNIITLPHEYSLGDVGFIDTYEKEIPGALYLLVITTKAQTSPRFISVVNYLAARNKPMLFLVADKEITNPELFSIISNNNTALIDFADDGTIASVRDNLINPDAEFQHGAIFFDRGDLKFSGSVNDKNTGAKTSQEIKEPAKPETQEISADTIPQEDSSNKDTVVAAATVTPEKEVIPEPVPEEIPEKVVVETNEIPKDETVNDTEVAPEITENPTVSAQSTYYDSNNEEEYDVTEDYESESTSRSKWKIWVLVALGLIIIGGALFWFFSSRKDSEVTCDTSEMVYEEVNSEEMQEDAIIEEDEFDLDEAQDEIDEMYDISDFDIVYLSGTIDNKYPIHMILDLNQRDAVYFYDRYGSSNLMGLRITQLRDIGNNLLLVVLEKPVHDDTPVEMWYGNLNNEGFTGSGEFLDKELPFELRVDSVHSGSNEILLEKYRLEKEQNSN